MRNIKKTSIAQMKDKKEETKFLSSAATLTQAEQEQVGGLGGNHCKICHFYTFCQNWPVIIRLTLQTNYEKKHKKNKKIKIKNNNLI